MFFMRGGDKVTAPPGFQQFRYIHDPSPIGESVGRFRAAYYEFLLDAPSFRLVQSPQAGRILNIQDRGAQAIARDSSHVVNARIGQALMRTKTFWVGRADFESLAAQTPGDSRLGCRTGRMPDFFKANRVYVL